jgi:hypothetical protein
MGYTDSMVHRGQAFFNSEIKVNIPLKLGIS